jgi:hypothetical protein
VARLRAFQIGNLQFAAGASAASPLPVQGFRRIVMSAAVPPVPIGGLDDDFGGGDRRFARRGPAMAASGR